MSKRLERELDIIYRDVIQLIYKNKCVFEHNCQDLDCGGALSVINVISRKNKFFRWDLNNGILLCEAHAKWWSDNRLEPYKLLHQTLPEVAEFHLINQSTIPTLPLDLGAIGAFLSEASIEAIKKGSAPFPSIHGRFDVY